MSDWRGHLKIGFVFQSIVLIGIIIYYIFSKTVPNTIDIILLPFIFILSPLISDVDHQSSKITLFFYLIGVAGLWPAYYFVLQYMLGVIIFLSLVVIFSQFVKHRGITHRWWAILIFYIGLALFTKHYTICIISFSGVISHLVADKMC